MGHARHTTPLCDSHPFQRHQPADVVGKVLQADFGLRPRDANRPYDPATRRVLLSTEQRSAYRAVKGFLGGQSFVVVVCAATLKILKINLFSPGQATRVHENSEAIPLR
jgi:hypothetical protein